MVSDVHLAVALLVFGGSGSFEVAARFGPPDRVSHVVRADLTSSQLAEVGRGPHPPPDSRAAPLRPRDFRARASRVQSRASPLIPHPAWRDFAPLPPFASRAHSTRLTRRPAWDPSTGDCIMTTAIALPRVLDDDRLRRSAPSVFAATPWRAMSERYRFVPTIHVIELLRDCGFRPINAMQSRCRIEGKGDFTRHMVRLRHADHLESAEAETPELILSNSHDGTSAYHFNSGVFRFVCSNGLIVASADFGGISVKHSGGKDFDSRMIDATFRIVQETPRTMARIEEWKATPLSMPQQLAFASAALEIKDSATEIEPARLIEARREEDRPAPDGSRDLWRTLNVAQEALSRGGVPGTARTGRRSTTRPIKGVDADIRTNRALWRLAEEMAKLA